MARGAGPSGGGGSSEFDQELAGLVEALQAYSGLEAAMRLRLLSELAQRVDTDTLLAFVADIVG